MAGTAALKPTDSGNASARLRATSPHFSLRFFRNRPDAHRDLCNLHEALARRTVTGLYGKAPGDGAEISGKDLDVGVGRDVARGDALAYSRSERLFRTGAILDHHLSHGGKAWRNVRARQRNHATGRKVLSREFTRRRFKKTVKSTSRVELVIQANKELRSLRNGIWRGLWGHCRVLRKRRKDHQQGDCTRQRKAPHDAHKHQLPEIVAGGLDDGEKERAAFEKTRKRASWTARSWPSQKLSGGWR